MGSYRSGIGMQIARFCPIVVVGFSLAVACAKSDDSVAAGGAGGTGAGGVDASGDGHASGGAKDGGGSGGTGGSTSGGGSGGSTGATGGTGGVAGAAGGGGTSGDASTGDAGCTAPSECPQPSNECLVATCSAGVCGTGNALAGTVPSNQVTGDCQKILCDGKGGSLTANDDTDLPDDKNPCTTDACLNGIPVHNLVAAGTSCGTGLVCDSTGKCSGCSVGTDCPGTDTECATRTCTSGVCGTSFATAGKKVTSQTAGDCKVKQCDGSGNIVTVNDNSDIPVDGKQCTNDVCTAGVPSNPASPSGTACSEGGGTVCNGAGVCVACTVPANCGADTECMKRTCVSNVCGTTNVSSGTPTTTQVTGDCKTSICDGSGGITTTPNNSDVPVDGKQCTGDICTNGVPSNPPLASGTSCSENGGIKCNGSGVCVECLTNSDCASGLCQNNVCGSVTCSTGKLDCDGQSGNGCECSGTICCSNTCSPKHQNGLGQTYENCSPLGTPGNAATYNVTMATDARAAWPQTGTDASAKCVGPGGGNIVYRQTATSCAVWAYSGTYAGYVHLSTTSTCACPTSSDPTWN